MYETHFSAEKKSKLVFNNDQPIFKTPAMTQLKSKHALFYLKEDNPQHLHDIQDYLEVIKIICSILLHGSAIFTVKLQNV